MDHRLNDFLKMEIQRLHGVETHILDALRIYTGVAEDDGLARTLQTHRWQTHTHVRRLQDVSLRKGWSPSAVSCAWGESMLLRMRRLLKRAGPSAKMDARITHLALRAKRWKIDGYHAAATLSRRLGDDESTALLGQTLSEEQDAEETLAAFATVRPLLRAGLGTRNV